MKPTPIYDGYVPPIYGKCIRCGADCDSLFYKLCEDCRFDDLYHVAEERAEERDRQAEISNARGE